MEELSSVFSGYTQIQKAILYGSRAMSTYRNGSDIDLIIPGENIDLPILQKIENDMDGFTAILYC